MAALLAIFIAIDYMFLDDAAFIFDPDIKVRARLFFSSGVAASFLQQRRR